MALAGIVEVLEQLVSRQVTTRFDDTREPRVVDVAIVAEPALAAETKPNVAAPDVGMAIAQRRQTKAVVRSGVFVVADPKQGLLQQPHDRRQHSPAAKTVAPEGRVNPRPNQGKRAREGKHLAGFRLVA